MPFGTTAVGANAVANPNAPVVGIAATHDGAGYWLVGSDGGVFGYGDAPFFGSTGSLHLNAPIVGMAATADGGGYWLVARDGGVFNYGDAGFFGSAGSLPLNAPIVGMAATHDGGGYWLVAADGGIFSYGDARFSGSTGGLVLNAPIVGMAATAGRWRLLARGGGRGDLQLRRRRASSGRPAPSSSTRPSWAWRRPSGGYWLVASDGGVFDYGAAPYFGSLGGTPLPAPVVGLAASPAAVGTGWRSAHRPPWPARWSASTPAITG